MINFSISSFTRLMLNMNVYRNFVQGNDKLQRDLLYPLHSSHKSCGLFFVRAESSRLLCPLLCYWYKVILAQNHFPECDKHTMIVDICAVSQIKLKMK